MYCPECGKVIIGTEYDVGEEVVHICPDKPNRAISVLAVEIKETDTRREILRKVKLEHLLQPTV